MITLTDFAKDHALRLSSGEAWLYLLKITFAQFSPSVFYYVNNTEQITSSGQVYNPCQFVFDLAINDNDHMAAMRLAIDNVERDLVAQVRKNSSAPQLEIKIVLASKPNDIQASFTGLSLKEITWSLAILEGSIYAEDLLSIRYPADLISYESGYQALFRQ